VITERSATVSPYFAIVVVLYILAALASGTMGSIL